MTPQTAIVSADGLGIGAVHRHIPLGRLTEPEAIADAVFFRGSPEARYTTGATLAVDGGLSAFADFGDASARLEQKTT
jgi:NAD(P)-dependent dehydrogenase (short-subunit alcohol dehydrogenase family)